MQTLSRRVSKMLALFLCSEILILALAFYFVHQQQVNLEDKRLFERLVLLDDAIFQEMVFQSEVENEQAIDLLVYELVQDQNLLHSQFSSVGDARTYLNQFTWDGTCSLPKGPSGAICRVDGTDIVIGVLPIQHDGALHGYLLRKDRTDKNILHKSIFVLYIAAALVIIFCLNIACLLLYFRKTVDKDLHHLLEYLALLQQSNVQSSQVTHASLKTAEFARIAQSIFMAWQRLQSIEREKVEVAEIQKRAKLATQVAHDIRSPLSSMQSVLRYFSNIQHPDPRFPDFLNLLQLCSTRLTTVADQLLEKHHSVENPHCIFSLHKILDELIGEFEGGDDAYAIEFIKGYHSKAVELFGDRGRLQRAFGNIVKNAVEAMRGHGIITIQTTTHPEKRTATITIADTGPGMSNTTLQKILQGGHSEGKADGHGIGMTVVRETTEAFGGQLSGASIIGHGTTFTLTLPLPTTKQSTSAKRELTAMAKLELPVYAGEPVLVVDDEPSMREQWRLLLESQGCQAIICTRYEDIRDQGITASMTRTAAVDYHFDNSEHSGEDVIRLLQEMGFQNLILCTAEYWKPLVQKLASELGVALCPKPLPKIEVRQQTADTTRQSKVLVLDDDAGTRLCWELEQERLGISELKTFASMEACEAAKTDYTTYDFAFVDKNIPKSVWRVDQIITHLKQAGVRQVIVASGESPEDLRNDPTCKAADDIIPSKIPENLPTDK